VAEEVELLGHDIDPQAAGLLTVIDGVDAQPAGHRNVVADGEALEGEAGEMTEAGDGDRTVEAAVWCLARQAQLAHGEIREVFENRVDLQPPG
jgi:hypothetical protein